jgi:hypothetical protein
MTESKESIRIGAPPSVPPPLVVVTPPKKRMRWEIPIVVATVGVLLVGGISLIGLLRGQSATPAPSPVGQMDVRGSITLPWSGSFLDPNSNECLGKDGYSDLAPGGQVTVTDETGKVVAVGRITTGQGSPYRDCVLLFEVAGVPRGAKFYGVEVTHRGKIQKTEGDLDSGTLNLTIG